MIIRLFDILKNISNIIANSDDHKSILTEIVKEVAKGLDAEVCSVYVYNKETNELILTATHGLNQKSTGKVKMKPGEGLTGRSFIKNELLNIVNPGQHPDFKYFKSTGEEKFESYLSVPLIIAGKRIGVMVIQKNTAEIFSDDIIDVVKSISSQLASVILNSNILTALAHVTSEEINYIKPITGNNIPQTINGTAGNTGIAIGKALIFQTSNYLDDIEYSLTDKTNEELTLLYRAVIITKRKTIELEEKALTMISEADASIFYAHLMFLEDKTLINKIKQEIVDNRFTAEYSVKLVFQEYQQRFMMLKNQSFKDKIMDLKDVILRLLETIASLKKNSCSEDDVNFIKSEQYILIAKELLPSDLLKMPAYNIKGIICEKGGIAAHIAVLAKAFDIPALLNAKNATEITENNDDIILDCFTETAYIRPEQDVKKHFNDIIKSHIDSEQYVMQENIPAITQDKQKIQLNANLTLVNEVALLNKYGAEGIGLYRTEFLYMIRDHLPSEQEQYQIFSTILKQAEGREVAIRALDVGADKPLPYLNAPKEDNPAMGNRGIRFLLANQNILRPHLRAILKAGIHGKLKIIIPMITNHEEIIKFKQVLRSVKNELKSQNIPYSDNYKLGMMLEVPSAVLDIGNMIPEVDFVSIGTNDLMQYIFASDRTNETLPNKDLSLNPVFLRVLHRIGNIFAEFPEKELSLCGEIAGNIYAIPYIIGAGIFKLSMPPKSIPTIKKVINSISLEESKKILSEAMTYKTTDSVMNLVKSYLKFKKLI